MKPNTYSFSRELLIKNLRKVKLVGYENPAIYRDANISVCTVSAGDLRPTQCYVLKSQLSVLENLRASGVYFTGLTGYLRLDLPPPLGLLTLTPPIVEEWDGHLILADGMHRCYLANKLGLPINVVKISNIPKDYPYYAYMLDNGWKGVQELDYLPENFVKKFYRDPDPKVYKDLFRNYGKIFAGIQTKRIATP